MNSIHYTPPSSDDLTGSVDITHYMTVDGLQIDSEYDTAIEAFRTACGHTIEVTAKDVQRLMQQLLSEPTQPPALRPMNTNMQYPTSTPPWKRGRK